MSVYFDAKCGGIMWLTLAINVVTLPTDFCAESRSRAVIQGSVFVDGVAVESLRQ